MIRLIRYFRWSSSQSFSALLFSATLFSSFVALVCLVAPSRTKAAKPERPNVLFIAVDDLRAELGCYGASHIQSPNIDALAKTGRRFERAYCQQAVCNPSRTSLMTGLRPDTIGVTGNHVHFRSKRPDVVTVAEYFKEHGYHTQSIGKIYHGVFPKGASITKWDTMGDPQSWSVPTTRFGPRYYYTEEGIEAAKETYRKVYRPKNPAPNDWTKKLVFGPMTESPDVDDETLYDGKVAAAAVQTLQSLSKQEKPFFLAVGFIKPHSPLVAAKKYWDRYDHAAIALAEQAELPHAAPKMAGHSSQEIRRYTDQPNSGPFSVDNQRRIKHGYYACISMIDNYIGKVLIELESQGLAENTIVVLFSDHGYHLGEQGLWGKTTNFELDTRVPLIIRVPGMKSPGESTRSLAELVDLYPTLSELAGLPIPQQLEGTSLAAVLDDPDAAPNTTAMSQFPRGGNADHGGKVMGYSLRTDQYRYTEWIDRQTESVVARELYEYEKNDWVEKQNLANNEHYAGQVRQLSQRLRKEIAFPPTVAIATKYDPQAAKVTPGLSSSFEECAEGSFKKMTSNVGVWTTTAGEVEIDPAHQHSGKNCLHLFGGAKCEVELAVDIDKPISSLTFHAERWTRRTPFSFHVDRFDGDKWSEIYDGSAVVSIGKFPVKVTIPLKSTPKRLRFRCTSPAKTGVMIDDLTFVTPTKQKITNVTVEPVQTPVLVGLKQNPLLRIRVDTEGSLEPISFLSVVGSLGGTIRNEDIASLQLFASDDSLQLKEGVKAITAPGGIGGYRFETEHALASGVNYFWISCALKEKANIDATIQATCSVLKFSNGQTFKPQATNATHRLGVAVRRHMQDGVHTCRIPGLATTKKGTLIGVYDLRNRAGGDLPGDIDVGMSRSTDGGQTWEPFQRIMDMGDDPAWRYDGIGDPAVLVDDNTGTIWVAATWSHGNRSWFGSGPGLKPEETGQFMLCRSDDDGVTWSKPINITKQVKKPEWCFLLQGPGKGITMRDGTIVFAAQYQDTPENKRLPRSTIIYSKDHGKTWQTGTGAFDDTTEAQVVELEPGVLMLNCRYNRASTRVVMMTRDMGKTWEKHTTSQRALIEPRACMASLINIDQEIGNKFSGRLLFSNPNSTAGRNHITIKGSLDSGATWPEQYRILLDEGNGRGYSCMSMINDKYVGILYESSRTDMAFQRVPLSVLFDESSDKSSNEKKQQTTHEASDDKTSLKLPQVFGDHMVLQADAELPVWGSSVAGATVSVDLGGVERSTKADVTGEWKVRLPARKASAKPLTLRVTSSKEQIEQQIVLNDILVGEVWVCAGQSNMEWQVRQSLHGKEELSAANHLQLRLLHFVPGASGSAGRYQQQHLERLNPNKFCQGKWQTANADSAASFSAVAWYFGRRLQSELGTPVGLICPAVGGTPAEAWVPRDALQADPQLNALVAGNWLDNTQLGDFCRERGFANLLPAIQAGKHIPGDANGPNHSFKPGFMFEAGIEPLIPFAIRGVIWYQGESNAETHSRIAQHERIFPLLVKQWRAHWQQGDFPFLWVQLPALGREHWPLFRDQQRRMLEIIPNSGMATTIDTGHPTSVHPALKKPVGERLATWALGDVYQRSNEKSFSGPLQANIKLESNSVRVTFEHTGNGLTTTDRKPPRHFEIAGDDGVWHPATATIEAKHAVVVSSQAVPQPTEVRYAWRPFPQPPVNLVNDGGLPASPFATSDSNVQGIDGRER